jgi:hypothetical protein
MTLPRSEPWATNQDAWACRTSCIRTGKFAADDSSEVEWSLVWSFRIDLGDNSSAAALVTHIYPSSSGPVIRVPRPGPLTQNEGLT